MAARLAIMSTDLPTCLQGLPACLHCSTPLPQLTHFLLLSCEHIICSKCTNVHRHQAFCDLHGQQAIGEVLEEVTGELQSLRELLQKPASESQTSALEAAALRIHQHLQHRKARLDKFRTKSLTFNSEQQDAGRLAVIQEKYERAPKHKAKTEAMVQPRPTLVSLCPFCQRSEPTAGCPTCGVLSGDNYNICKICFRVNSDEVLVCPGCRCKDGVIVWVCRGCKGRNQNGVMACQHCGREDEFQVELFRRRS